MSVVFKTCKLFDETSAKHFTDAKVKQAFAEFIQLKSADPMKPYGAKDFPMKGNGPLHGLLHAALAHDVRIMYQLKGKNPTVVYLYAIGTHDETGTGQPANLKRQKQLKNRIDNQEF